MAEKKCNNCSTDKTPASVPYVVHESAMARAERQNKSLVWVIVLLIVLLVGSNIGWLVYESQFETVESTTEESYDITQDAENGNNNSIINGGEIVNGKTNDKVQENNNN